VIEIGDSKPMISETGPRGPRPCFSLCVRDRRASTYRRALEFGAFPEQGMPLGQTRVSPLGEAAPGGEGEPALTDLCVRRPETMVLYRCEGCQEPCAASARSSAMRSSSAGCAGRGLPLASDRPATKIRLQAQRQSRFRFLLTE